MSENKTNENVITVGNAVSFIVGVGAGLLICFLLSGDPAADPEINIDNNLITNAEAIAMIQNFSPCFEKDSTVSGHLEKDVLLAYISKMDNQCQSIGLELSGLEYYFAKYQGDEINDDRRTVLFYPTYKDTINPDSIIHIPFDPFSSSEGANPMHVITMSRAAARVDSVNASRCVLDKSNMSPPRQPTF